MLTAVDITNTRSDTLHLSLMDPSAGYVIRGIDGLDPVDAALTTSALAQVDGAQPQNARRDIRNITMKLGLKPDYVSTTVQSLRSNLYRYFLPKANVTLGFYLDGVLYVVSSGQVESCKNAMFSADPEVDISIVCYDPDFYGPAAETISTHTQSDYLTTRAIQYEGSSDAGFIFTLNVDRAITGFTIKNTTPDNTVNTFEVLGSFISGDVITINTIPGSKALTLTRAGVTTSVLYYKNILSTWPILQAGINQFGAFAAGAGIGYTLTYTPKYGGL